MNKDEILPNSSTETPSQRRKPRVLDWMIPIISVIAILLSSTAIVLYQHLASHLPDRHEPNTQQTASTVQALQTELQQVSQYTKDLALSIATNEQRLQAIAKQSSKSPDDWQLKRARYYLELAQINADWTHDIPSIITLLKHADTILANIPNLSLQQTRQAIAQDLLNLEQIPKIDTYGILAKLQTIQKTITTLSAKPYMTTATSTQIAPSSPTTWREQLRSNFKELRNLVVIHHQDEAFLAQLSPQYVIFLQETIRMNLQEAEIGLIEHRSVLYSAGLQSAIRNICHGFNPNDLKAQTIIQLLKSLQKITVTQKIPTLNHYAQILDRDLSSHHEVSLPDIETTP